MRFTRSMANGTTEYRAEGESFRYVAKRVSKDRWALAISKLETVAGIRVAVQGGPFHEAWHDTLTTCKTVAAEFETLTDGYRSAEHGHRERYTEAVLKAYGQAVDQEVCATPADAGMITEAITDTDKGDNATMAENTAQATDNDRIVEEVSANIERAKSLAEAENVEALEELNTETETLISRLPARGKTTNGQSWTAAKKELRNGFKAAAMVQEKPAEKKKAEPKAEVAVKSFEDFEGVTELVALGAEKATAGITAHIRTSHMAAEIAGVLLDIRKRIPNKDENPDLDARSDQAKKAATALYVASAEQMAKAGTDEFEYVQALKKLQRAVQYQMSTAQANYLLSLDTDEKEAARFTKVLEGKPEDMPASEWVANKYELRLKGQHEIDRENYAKKKELEAAKKSGEPIKTSGEGGEGEGDGDTTPVNPDEHIANIVAKMVKDAHAAKKALFEAGSEEAKKKAATDLEEVTQLVRELRQALI